MREILKLIELFHIADSTRNCQMRSFLKKHLASLYKFSIWKLDQWSWSSILENETTYRIFIRVKVKEQKQKKKEKEKERKESKTRYLKKLSRDGE